MFYLPAVIELYEKSHGGQTGATHFIPSPKNITPGSINAQYIVF